MTFHSSIFQAYCFGHPCQVSLGERGAPCSASLVTISSRSARIKMDDGSSLPSCGEAAQLAPRFLDGVQVGDIQARVEQVTGKELLLSFMAPLSMPGARLCQLTRR